MTNEINTISDEALLAVDPAMLTPSSLRSPPPTAAPTAVPTPAVTPDRDAQRVAALGACHAAALKTIEEQTGYIEEYPSLPDYRIAQYITSAHLDNGSRFKLFTFLAMNRCPPILIVELAAAAGSLHNQAAADHVISIVSKMHKGTFTQYKAYCMESQAWEAVSPPKSTRDWHKDEAEWLPALTLARRIRHRLHTVERRFVAVRRRKGRG